MTKPLKIKTVGTNLVIRNSEGEIYEKFVETEKVLLRKDVEENYIDEGDYLISVEKKKDEIIIPDFVIQALKDGKELQVIEPEPELETPESEEE